MWLRINPRLTTPVYLQVIDGVKTAVAKGIVKPGDRLPSVRELATEMAINHNTIAKAYQELERERVIEVVRGRGTFVVQQLSPPNREERLERMRSTIESLLVEAHHLQLDGKEVLAMFQRVLNEWEEIRDDRSVGH